MDQKNEVKLLVGGKKYLGWTEIQIESGLTSFSRGCSLVATRNSRTASLCDGIEEGLEAVVKIGDDTVLTGYIVKKVTSYGAKEAKIQITIKSKTVDLEECTIPLGKPHEWTGVSVAAVIKELAAHYGINVVDNGLGSGIKQALRVSPSSVISGEILKLLRKDSLLITDDELGRLVICSSGLQGSASECLEYGKNILTGERTHDVSKVFKHYAVIGQGADPKSERSVPGNSLKGVADNPLFDRERWSVTEQSGNRTANDIQARADHLALNSIGNADVLKYTVQGWRQSGGGLWKPNMTVSVRDPMLDFRGILLISKVTHSLRNGDGSTTVLELKSKDAFIQTDLPEEEKATGNKAKKAVATAKRGTTFLAKAGSGKL